jgi:hypothetical protein
MTRFWVRRLPEPLVTLPSAQEEGCSMIISSDCWWYNECKIKSQIAPRVSRWLRISSSCMWPFRLASFAMSTGAECRCSSAKQKVWRSVALDCIQEATCNDFLIIDQQSEKQLVMTFWLLINKAHGFYKKHGNKRTNLYSCTTFSNSWLEVTISRGWWIFTGSSRRWCSNRKEKIPWIPLTRDIMSVCPKASIFWWIWIYVVLIFIMTAGNQGGWRLVDVTLTEGLDDTLQWKAPALNNILLIHTKHLAFGTHTKFKFGVKTP